MAIEDNVDIADHWFAGEDKILEFEIFADPVNKPAGYRPEADPEAAMENIAGYTFSYALSTVVSRMTPHRTVGTEVVTKSGGAITVVGTFNATRSLNTQRARVPIAAADTAALAGGDYTQALKRADAGHKSVLSYGTVQLLVAAE